MRMEINVAIDDDEITIDSVVRGAMKIGVVRRGIFTAHLVSVTDIYKVNFLR